ncbi:FlgN protein [Treponema sp. JC4]|uniref:hypothetical protein n=1 Tax=Treponema sp. JC4 TaxID=1124982 RepID=UPI00025B06F9|nr:hypothetical protein [Treponema sp. JC4]EID85417.1 FlgN protein [Treponema sp. JC4]
MNEEFKIILEDENNLLDHITEEQSALRLAVEKKNWNDLMTSISEINLMSDAFKTLDTRREKLQKSINRDELASYSETLLNLRSKLLKCKAENKAFASYVSISRSFIQQVVEKALPQSRNKNYSRTGHIVQPQPQSVVVNQLF